MELSRDTGKLDQFFKLEVILKIERRFGDNVFVVQRDGSVYEYKRFTACKNVVATTIASGATLQMGILPVAPLNVPARYASNMMLKFSSPIVVHSHSSLEGYFKMPYEIAAVSFDHGDARIIDAVSLSLPKYALYDTPENGVICRSYSTALFQKVPSPALHQEAIGRINIHNTTDTAQSINKVVFLADGVDFYFDKTRVFFKDVEANIKEINNKTVLETNIADALWTHNTTGLGQKQITRYIMEQGF
jgi:uncharacterized protein